MNIQRNKNGTVILEDELPFAILEQHEESALKHLGKELSLPGFRKGHVPAETLKKNIDPARILEESANRALAIELPKLFVEHDIVPIGRPSITITKLAHGNPLCFKVETAVLPEVSLPDYKKIAQETEQENTEVTDEDVKEAEKEILTRIAHQEYHAKNPDDTEHKHGELPLPNLDDELATKLGYKNVDDFRIKLKEQIDVHKQHQTKEKRRGAIIERILSEVSTTIPDVLIEGELANMQAQFRTDVERVGIKFEDYLQQIKKDEEQLKKEWRPDAEKRAKMQLVLNKIAQEENITPDPSQVKLEVDKILSAHKEAHKTAVEVFVVTQLTNELVFQFLENQS